MTIKENLIRCLNDWDSHELHHIELVWTNGEKAGIGNPRAMEVAMDALRKELHKQINES